MRATLTRLKLDRHEFEATTFSTSWPFLEHLPHQSKCLFQVISISALPVVLFSGILFAVSITDVTEMFAHKSNNF